MSLIYKARDQLLENDFNKKVFDINEIKVEGIGSFINKIISKEKRNKSIWQDILNFTKKWKVNPKIITQLHSNYKNGKKIVDGIDLAKCFYLIV